MGINNIPPGGLDNALLMTDGTVMCGNGGSTWYKYTPDSKGSYTNGTWTTLASTTYTRLFFSSQVLPTGNVYVAGGEDGTGTTFAELYNYLANSWSVIPGPSGVHYSDAVSALLPNGNVLQGTTGSATYIYNVATNTITGTSGVGQPAHQQNEACWCRLPSDNILTVDNYSTNSEHYVPANNVWITDGSVPVDVYGYGSELGPLIVLPNGKAFQIGATSNTAIYTPGSTPTAAGSWVADAVIPNSLGAVDAPACMMNNGKILCAVGTTATFGSASNYYEYQYNKDPVDHPGFGTFTQVTGPDGNLTYGTAEFATSMLQLPDGGVFFIGGQGSKFVKIYYPDGTPLQTGQPTLSSATLNSDGSFTLTGIGLAGISAGAAYGDDWQMASNYPIVKVTDGSGNVTFGRTYNWSSTTIQNPNPVRTQFTLPSTFPNGNYTIQVIANGNPSAGVAFTLAGTVTSPVLGLSFTSVTSNSMSFQWNSLAENESAYQVQKSTDGVNFTTILTVGSSTTTYTDNNVSPLGTYYYRVLGVNPVGVGLACPALFAAAPALQALPAPWISQDIGEVGGSGTAGQSSGVYTLVGSGTSLNGTDDQARFAYQGTLGDGSIVARVTTSGASGFAGLAIRNGYGSTSTSVAMGFSAASHVPQLTVRLATGLSSTTASASGSFTSPIWLKLTRAGGLVTGFYSTDGVNWTQQGSTFAVLEETTDSGLIVCSNNNTLLASATFDNVSFIGSAAAVTPPLIDWKLDETSGTTAVDSRNGLNATYTGGVTLGVAGALPSTNTAITLDGSTGYVDGPTLNLNSNTVTLTGWINSAANQPYRTGVIFTRNTTTSIGAGLRIGSANTTPSDNLLGYLWGNNNFSNSTLAVPNNKWTFVALVVQPTQAVIYMMPAGGSLQSQTFAATNPLYPFDTDLFVGQDLGGGAGRVFKGSFDDVQVFNRALTATEIQKIASGAPTTDVTSPTVPQITIPSNVGLVLQSTNGNGTSFEWFQASGPGAASFANFTAASTVAQFSVPGTYLIELTASDGSGMNSLIPVAVNVGAALAGADIGNPGKPGSTSVSNGIYTLVGGGANIGGTSDQFQYAYMPLGSGTQVQARVVSQTPSGALAKAGVMIRNSTAAGAAYAEVHLTDTSGITFSWRSADGVASSNTHVNSIAQPVYVRVSESAGIFSGFYSTDGSTWTQVGGAQLVSLGSSPLVGLVECAANNSLTETGVFDSFAVTPAASNVGPSVAVQSNFTVNATSTSLTGSASDDGLPTGSTLTTLWSQVSGPGTVTFNNPASLTPNATASLNGTYDLRLSATDGQVTTCNDVLVTFSDPFNAWRSTYFTSQQLSNPAISGPTATPAGDGMENLLKYAFGLAPLSPDSGGKFPAGGVSGSNVTITYFRNTTATDLTWQVQQSTDLVHWMPASVSEAILTTNGNVQTVRDSVATNGAAQLFLRLSISMP
jgi:hypothetical protein